jgi:hypothetical protein
LICGGARETKEPTQSANPAAAVIALLGVELQAPSRPPAEIALDVVREVTLRPHVIVFTTEELHRASLGSSSQDIIAHKSAPRS